MSFHILRRLHFTRVQNGGQHRILHIRIRQGNVVYGKNFHSLDSNVKMLNLYWINLPSIYTQLLVKESCSILFLFFVQSMYTFCINQVDVYS